MKQSQQVLEWQQEARVETLRDSPLSILRHRFLQQVPADLAATIAQTSDLIELSRWLLASATANSIEAFRAALETEGNTGTPHAGVSGQQGV